MPATKEPTLPLLLLLAAGAAAAGSFVVWNFGSSRLGDPNVCEGLGFGCSTSQLTETLAVVGVLWAFLLAAALVARLAAASNGSLPSPASTRAPRFAGVEGSSEGGAVRPWLRLRLRAARPRMVCRSSAPGLREDRVQAAHQFSRSVARSAAARVGST